MGFDIVRDKVLLGIIVGVDEGVSVDVIVGSYLWTVEARLFPCNIRVGAFCKVSFSPWKRMDRRIRETAISGSVAEENNKQQFASIFRHGDEKWKDRRCGFLVYSRIDGNDPETVIFSCHGGFVATEEPLLNAALGSFFSGRADFEKGKLVKVRGAPYVDKWFSYYAERGEDGSKHMVIDDALTKVFLSREDAAGHALVVWLRYEQPFKTWGLVKVDETEPIRAINCNTVAGCEYELERDLLGGLIMPTVAEDGEDSDEVEEHA